MSRRKISSNEELAAYIQEKVNLLEKVATFHVLNRIIKQWKTYSTFYFEYDMEGESAFWRKYSAWFHLDNLQKIVTVPWVNGKQKRILNEVLARLNNELIIYRPNTSIHYKSGKSYIIHSGFFLPIERIKKLLKDGSALTLKSDYYSDEEAYYIKKYVLKYADAKRPKRTKYKQKPSPKATAMMHRTRTEDMERLERDFDELPY